MITYVCLFVKHHFCVCLMNYIITFNAVFGFYLYSNTNQVLNSQKHPDQ